MFQSRDGRDSHFSFFFRIIKIRLSTDPNDNKRNVIKAYTRRDKTSKGMAWVALSGRGCGWGTGHTQTCQQSVFVTTVLSHKDSSIAIVPPLEPSLVAPTNSSDTTSRVFDSSKLVSGVLIGY